MAVINIIIGYHYYFEEKNKKQKAKVMQMDATITGAYGKSNL